MFRLLARTALLLYTFLAAAGVTAQVSVSSSEHPIYVNHQYGFTLHLPPNLTLDMTAPPNPDHGFSIAMPNHEQLWVDASPTDLTLSRQTARIVAGCHTKQRKNLRWAGKTAVFLQVDCPATQYNRGYQERITMAVVSAPGRSDLCYQVGLRTESGTNSPASVILLQRLVAALSFTPTGAQPSD